MRPLPDPSASCVLNVDRAEDGDRGRHDLFVVVQARYQPLESSSALASGSAAVVTGVSESRQIKAWPSQFVVSSVSHVEVVGTSFTMKK